MKTLLQLRLSVLIAFLFLSIFGVAQNYETSKTLNKSTKVPENVVIEMKNHSGDLVFITDNTGQVSIKTTVNIEAKSEEDARKLLKAIEDFEFELSGNRLEINTRFYTNMNSTNSRTTMVLLNRDKIQIKNFEIKHEVHIPKSAQLELENKYSHVTLPDLEKEVKINLYSGKMTAGDYQSDFELTAKYSEITAGDFMGNTNFELYDSDVEFDSSQDLEINSKYSKVEAEKTGELEVESYDDKFHIEEISSLKLDAKYSELESKAALNNIRLELYDCTIIVESAKNTQFNGKYSKLELGDVQTLKIDDVYDSKLTLEKTGSIEVGKSKYSEYYLDENSKFSIDESYDDAVEIRKLNSDFSGISINGKYTKLNVNAGSVPFKADVAMKYGKVDFPSTMKVVKQIEKNSEMEIEGDNGGGSSIVVRGYDNTVVVK